MRGTRHPVQAAKRPPRLRIQATPFGFRRYHHLVRPWNRTCRRRPQALHLPASSRLPLALRPYSPEYFVDLPDREDRQRGSTSTNGSEKGRCCDNGTGALGTLLSEHSSSLAFQLGSSVTAACCHTIDVKSINRIPIILVVKPLPLYSKTTLMIAILMYTFTA